MEKSWKKVVGLRAKNYGYLIDDGNEDKTEKVAEIYKKQ